MAGRSTFAVKLPAILVGLVAVGFGYVLSCHFAPDSARYIHDILFALRRDISPDLLDAGKFNKLGHGGQVIFFERKIGSNQIGEVFIRQVDRDRDNEPTIERIYTASRGVFGGGRGDRWVALVDGTVVISMRDVADARKVEFNELIWRPLALQGGAKVRGYRIYDELPTLEFIAAREAALADSNLAREWAKEAVKRFAVPALALIHTLLGLELLTLFGVMNDRQGYLATLLNGILVGCHVIIVLMAEIVGQVGAELVWVVIALIIFELLVALALMSRGLRWRLQQVIDNAAMPRLPLFERFELLFDGKTAGSRSS